MFAHYEIVEIKDDIIFISEINETKSVFLDKEYVSEEIKYTFPGKTIVCRSTNNKWYKFQRKINYDRITGWSTEIVEYEGETPELSKITNCPTSVIFRSEINILK
jgi:hypothetical protein